MNFALKPGYPSEFGALVTDESMTTRFQPGDLAIVDLHTPPRYGNVDVYLRFKDGTHRIRLLLDEFDGKIVVGAYDGSGDVDVIDRSNLLGMYTITARVFNSEDPAVRALYPDIEEHFESNRHSDLRA